jgi:hypothetical protein
MNAELKLIANPKSRKDWENNKQYYRQKFFSKSQLKKVEDDKRKCEIASKVIDQRSNGGGCNALTASCYNCPDYANANKKRNALIEEGDKYAVLLANCPTQWKEIMRIKKEEEENARKLKRLSKKGKHFDDEEEEEEAEEATTEEWNAEEVGVKEAEEMKPVAVVEQPVVFAHPDVVVDDWEDY